MPKKKLIEVALPLEAINEESASEKLIRRGLPSSIHLWWARRPLAACRAVLFASLVDDPSEYIEDEEKQKEERERLFGVIKKLVLWKNANDPDVLAEARAEIMRSTDGHPPPVLDPFCGGGSIPLEAQRLGLEAHASDLNPVAVLITKALIEIPPKFAGKPPVNPEARAKIASGAGWRGAQGLAEDVRYYGKWMRDEAARRIGHLYPKVKLPPEKGGGEATVIAWLWARTVKCPNPACGARMPLVRSFALSTKKGKETWIEPIVDRVAKTFRFEIRAGAGDVPKETSNRNGARCLFCDTHVPKQLLRDQATNYGLGDAPFAVVGDDGRNRIYLPFPPDHVPNITKPSVPELEQPITNDRRWFSPPLYGMKTYADLFTPRQLTALTMFGDLVREARERVLADARTAGLSDDGLGISAGGTSATAYADVITTYLAFAVSKAANRNSSLCSWQVGYDRMRDTFGRQALPMMWDYVETNPIAGAGGDIAGSASMISETLSNLYSKVPSYVLQKNALEVEMQFPCLISTDPPYYDNIGYADLSDFFYLWLRRSLATLFPSQFRTLLTPKTEELVATPLRFDGDTGKARAFFENGLAAAFDRMRQTQHPGYPLSIFYAFRQSEEEDDEGNGNGGAVSTGWDTMLQGLIDAGFSIHGTWPMRSELSNRPVASGTNALASSIVLVCRPRPEDASVSTRREFMDALRRELPDALRKLQQGNIAPVDLAQASIGPGMAVYSRYSRVLESDGSRMPVRTALAIINATLDEVLAAQEGEFDSDTRFAVSWFAQRGMEDGPYGDAETLARARNVSVEGLAEAGVLLARAGKVRLLRRDELPEGWDPRKDERLTTWEIAHHLIRALEDGGEDRAAEMLHRVGPKAFEARDLAYRLYQICERKGWAKLALGYNALVINWPRLIDLANVQPTAPQEEQTSLL